MNTPETSDRTSLAAEIEPAVAHLWREVLGHPGPISGGDNFFALGGDSLTMMLFLFRVQETFGVELPAAAMLDAPDLREVCRALHDAVAPATSAPSS